MNNFWKFEFRNAPKPAKALALGYLMAISLAYVYALGHIMHAVGWTPAAIATHYYGAPPRVVELDVDKENQTSGEEVFSFDEEIAEPDVAMGARPSFRNLVATGHFHLFGMSSFFFGLTLLGLFVRLKDNWKSILVFMPYVAVVLDNLSFLATRFGGPEFAYLTAFAGAIMGSSFFALWLLILREVFSSPENA